jgi:two-component system, NarL family, nitrate/nitrite response regulator NarL
MSELTDDGRVLRVVIADDEPDVRMLLRLQLKQVGFDVVGEAGDGAEAVEACERLRPEALVLDLLMPRMTGFEAIPLLRRNDPTLAIIAYTAVAGDFVRREMARLRIPLLLKSGDVQPLADALREGIASTPKTPR